MSSFSSLEHLYHNIKKTHPGMTPAQVRAEAERYLGGALQPMLSEQEIFAVIERGQGIEANQNAGDGQYRREGVPPRSLPRYTDTERRARRAKAKKLRDGIYDFFEYQNSYLDEYKYRLETGGIDPRDPGLTPEQRAEIEENARSYDRGDQRLFYYIDPTASLEEQVRMENANQEIAFLFDKNDAHWNKFYQRRVADLKESHDPAFAEKSDEEIREQIETDIRDRRGQILMQRMRESAALLDHVEDMSDPSLPTEQLVANYITLQKAAHVTHEIDGQLAKNGSFFTVSEEDAQWLRDFQKAQSCFGLALERIAAYANPISEFLDPASLADYDCIALQPAHENLFESADRGMPFQERREAKHRNFRAYAADGVQDNFTNLLYDAAGTLFVQRDTEIDERFDRTVKDFGFTLGENGANCTCEQFDRAGNCSINQNAGVEELKSGRPLVFRQDGRVAVLSLRSPLSYEMVWDKPETLFNYSLEYQNDKLLKQLAQADKWYKTRSPQFRNMRRNFEALTASVKGLDGSPEQREQVNQKYSELLELCDAYLATKPQNGVGKNTLEQGHMDAANAIRTYAANKLEELTVVAGARRDLEQYRNMPAGQIRGAAAQAQQAALAQQAQEALAAQQQQEQEAHVAELREARADLKKWLGDQVRAPYVLDAPQHIKVSVWTGMSVLQRYCYRNDANEGGVLCSSTPVTQGKARNMVGALIALEMVNREREQLRADNRQAGPGPLEQLFNGANREKDCDDEFITLGNAAVKHMTNVDIANDEDMADLQLTDLLQSFDAQALADALPETKDLRERVNAAAQQEAEARALREQQEQEARTNAVNVLRNAAKPFGTAGTGAINGFTADNITKPINKLSEDLASGIKNTDMAVSWHLMRDCVIHSMIQLDDIGSGDAHRFDRMLRDPQALEVLRHAVETTGPFKEMVVKTLSEGGEHASITAISNLLAQKAPQTVARQILANAAFKGQVESGLKDCGIILGKGVDLRKPLQRAK